MLCHGLCHGLGPLLCWGSSQPGPFWSEMGDGASYLLGGPEDSKRCRACRGLCEHARPRHHTASTFTMVQRLWAACGSGPGERGGPFSLTTPGRGARTGQARWRRWRGLWRLQVSWGHPAAAGGEGPRGGRRHFFSDQSSLLHSVLPERPLGGVPGDRPLTPPWTQAEVAGSKTAICHFIMGLTDECGAGTAVLQRSSGSRAAEGPVTCVTQCVRPPARCR